MMYKVIKKACDLTAGAQSFFINRATYETKFHATPDDIDPAALISDDIRRRLHLANPRMLKQGINSSCVKDLAIAIHVAPISSPAPGSPAQQDKSPELYLVTLVSRNREESDQYRAEAGIFTRRLIKSQEHISLLRPFLALLSGHTLTILRSGYMSTATDVSTPKYSIDLTKSSSFADELSYSQGQNRQMTAIRHPNIRSEAGAIGCAFGQIKGAGELRYITLTEDAALETRMDTARFEEACNTRREECRFMDNVFIKDMLVNGQAQSVKVQQIQGKGNNANIVSGAVMATFHTVNDLVVKIQHTPQHRLSKKGSLANLAGAASGQDSPTANRLFHQTQTSINKARSPLGGLAHRPVSTAPSDAESERSGSPEKEDSAPETHPTTRWGQDVLQLRTACPTTP